MSRVNFGAKPNMYPLPVLIIATYDKDGNPDAMNAAWGVVTDFNESSQRKKLSYRNMIRHQKRKAKRNKPSVPAKAAQQSFPAR